MLSALQNSRKTAQMVMFVLVMGAMSTRVEWSCVFMADGGPSVMTAGTAEMLKSSVDNWDTQRMDYLGLHMEPTLERVMVSFFWTRWHVREQRTVC